MTKGVVQFRHPWPEIVDVYDKGASVLTARVAGEYYSTIYYSGVGYDGKDTQVVIAVAVRETPESALEEAKRLAAQHYESVRVEAMAKIKTFDK